MTDVDCDPESPEEMLLSSCMLPAVVHTAGGAISFTCVSATGAALENVASAPFDIDELSKGPVDIIGETAIVDGGGGGGAIGTSSVVGPTSDTAAD